VAKPSSKSQNVPHLKIALGQTPHGHSNPQLVKNTRFRDPKTNPKTNIALSASSRYFACHDQP
jgi:hypothetical protein